MWIWRWIADDIQGKKHHDLFLPRTHDNHGEIMVKSPHFVTWPRCGGTPKTFVDQTAVPWRNFFQSTGDVPQKSGDILYVGHILDHIYIYYVYVFTYIHIHIYTYMIMMYMYMYMCVDSMQCNWCCRISILYLYNMKVQNGQHSVWIYTVYTGYNMILIHPSGLVHTLPY